jgi:hypothetical protein
MLPTPHATATLAATINNIKPKTRRCFCFIALITLVKVYICRLRPWANHAGLSAIACARQRAVGLLGRMPPAAVARVGCTAQIVYSKLARAFNKRAARGR